MMWTLAVLNQKGGVGKSTLAVNLAAAAHLRRRRVLIVDLDSQGSALDWSAARGEGSRLAGLSVVKADRALSLARFREIASSYDVVVLDGPPKLSDMTRSAAIAADVVVIPVQPGPFDLWGSAETAACLDAADGARDNRPAARRLYVLNRASSRTRLSREAARVLALRVPLARVVVYNRVAFAEAAATGESVLTTDPRGAAASEIRALYREVTRP